MSKNKKTKIQTTKLENIALDRLKKHLAKNELTLADFTLDQIKAKYKTFRDSERKPEELELMICQHLGYPIDLFRANKESHFDVPEGYQGVSRGYLRVSSDRESERQDTERQRRELLAIDPDMIIYEDYASGTKSERIEYNKMLREAKTKDCIYATEISRLSRSSLDLINLLEDIKKYKMCLKAGSLIFDCREGAVDPLTEGMIKMMSVFAELERNLISTRSKSGIANARAKGKTIGRPSVLVEDLPESFVTYYPMYRDRKQTGYKITQQGLAKMCECGNRDTMRRYIKVAEDYEREHGERLEDFRERIKDKEEFEKWKLIQQFHSAQDIQFTDTEE